MLAVAFAEAGEFQTAQQIMIEEENHEAEKLTLSKKMEGRKALGAN
jgi:hypothetical protein